MAFLAYCGLLYCGCASGTDAESNDTLSVNPAPQQQLTFQPCPAGSPVIFSGTVNTPMFVIDPCVIQDKEGYHLFYSSLFCKTPSGLSAYWNVDLPYEGNITKLVTGIAYAFSSDQGLTWELRDSPILTPGEAEWENFRVETANAIVHEDTLHLFYCADGSRNGKLFIARYQVGVVSMALNGKTIRENLIGRKRVFKQTRTKPLIPYVLDRRSRFNNAQEPTVLYNRGHFELFFTGLSWKLPAEPKTHPDQKITGIAVGRAILNDSLEVEEIREIPVSIAINTIEVRRARGKYYMFGSVPDPANGRGAIAYLTSDDGIHWSQPVTILERRRNTTFADDAVMCPTAVLEPDKVVLFYAATHTSSERPKDRWGAQSSRDRFLFVTLGRAVSQ